MTNDQRLTTNDQRLIIALGLIGFSIYVVFLCFRPQESWVDDAFWADWARQLAVHNRYYTTVWGFGHPSYCPLYVFIMALWYKVVGFSFFTAQFPNIIFTLLTYFLFAFILTERKRITTWQSIVAFSTLFWLTPSMFWIYNCGRIEILCLLLGTLTAYSFVRSLETNALKHKIQLFLFSFLLFATGVEGVVFATLFIALYSAFNLRSVWRNKTLLIWCLGGGYITSLGCLSVITWRVNCLHQFYDTMFGFSKTFSKFYFYIRSFVKGAKHGDIVTNMPQPAATNKISIWQQFADGLLINKEYLALLLLIIILFAITIYIIKWKNINKTTQLMVMLSVITPFVYVMAGRYVSYYTWTAYIPSVITIVMLIEQLHFKWLHIMISLAVATLFFTPYNSFLYKIDFSGQQDAQNIADIAEAEINPQVPTVIPYQWYYYIVNTNENIYFQGSGAYPDDLKIIIYSPTDYNEKQFMNRYQLTEQKRIGNKIIYQIANAPTF